MISLLARLIVVNFSGTIETISVAFFLNRTNLKQISYFSYHTFTLQRTITIERKIYNIKLCVHIIAPWAVDRYRSVDQLVLVRREINYLHYFRFFLIVQFWTMFYVSALPITVHVSFWNAFPWSVNEIYMYLIAFFHRKKEVKCGLHTALC